MVARFLELGRVGLVWWLDIFGEEINCVGHPFGSGPDDIDCVAAVVLEGWSDIPPLFAMRIPRGALVRAFMDEDAGTGRCKGGSIEIKGTMELFMCGDGWVEPRWSQEI